MTNPSYCRDMAWNELSKRFLLGLICFGLAPIASLAIAKPMQLAGGALLLDAPEDWETVKPANRLIEQELSITPPEGSNLKPARLTMMQAGGSVEANIARWVGQFQGNEGGADRSTTKTEKIEVEGMPVTVVELGGTYMESMRGPFGPKTPRNEYRLVGAIIETGKVGNYFFKLIGPNEVVSPAADEFRSMIKSLKMSKAAAAIE